MDEAGYTGEDLLNRDQPVFALASTNLSEDAARRLRDDVFGGVRSAELKHTVLVRRPSGKNRVVHFIEEIQQLREHFSLWLLHKRFVLFQKLVDQWLEPVMHRTGYNLYHRGENIAFCNMAYACIPAFESDEFLEEILWRFQELMRRPDPVKFHMFWLYLNRKKQECRKQAAWLLDLIGLGQHLGYRHIADLGERSLDLALTAAVETIGHWRNLSPGPFEVVHDQSSNFARDLWQWEALVSPNAPPAVAGHPDHRKRIYPLNAERTSFCDSGSQLQLQLCDILAGAAVAFAMSRAFPNAECSEYADRLEQAGISDLPLYAIWPSTDIEPLEPEQADVPVIDGNEYAAARLAEAHRPARQVSR